MDKEITELESNETADSQYNMVSDSSGNSEDLSSVDVEDQSETSSDEFPVTDSSEHEDDSVSEKELAVTELESNIDYYTVVENQEKLLEQSKATNQLLLGLLAMLVIAVFAWGLIEFCKWIYRNLV